MYNLLNCIQHSPAGSSGFDLVVVLEPWTTLHSKQNTNASLLRQCMALLPDHGGWIVGMDEHPFELPLLSKGFCCRGADHAICLHSQCSQLLSTQPRLRVISKRRCCTVFTAIGRVDPCDHDIEMRKDPGI